MRKSNIEEGRRWLEQAIEDLKWAKDLAERGGYHIACFLAQQVGEKESFSLRRGRGNCYRTFYRKTMPFRLNVRHRVFGKGQKLGNPGWILCTHEVPK